MADSVPAGLCAACQFRRVITSRSGSTFIYCRRADADPRFPRYPRLPVLSCAGYEPQRPGEPPMADPAR